MWIIYSGTSIKSWVSGIFPSAKDALDYLTSMSAPPGSFGSDVVHQIKFAEGIFLMRDQLQ
jgi:hypothetical protein